MNKEEIERIVEEKVNTYLVKVLPNMIRGFIIDDSGSTEEYSDRYWCFNCGDDFHKETKCGCIEEGRLPDTVDFIPIRSSVL